MASSPFGIFPTADRHARDAFTRAGAVSPATARPLEEIGDVDAANFQGLVDRGVVREGPTGQFYYYQPAGGAYRRRAVRVIVFWLVVILVPILLLQFTGPR